MTSHDSSLNFCSHCGSTLEVRQVEGRRRRACPSCGRVHYENPKLAVAVILAQDGEILLGRRAINPGRGNWSFPSGYVDRGEVVEEAAVREVKEETGLEISLKGLVGLYSATGDPVALAVYAGEVIHGVPKPGAEMTEVGYFPLDNLPTLAFSHDRQILEDWARSLKHGSPSNRKGHKSRKAG